MKELSSFSIQPLLFVILITTFSTLNTAEARPRFDFGYFMRFATFDYIPGEGANSQVVDLTYPASGTSGTDTYLSISGYLGNWETKLTTNMRSTIYKVPGNVPVPPEPNDPQKIMTGMTGLRFSYGKANITPFFGIVSDSLLYVPLQSDSSIFFAIKSKAINYVTIGGTISASGSRPKLDVKGSMEMLIQTSAPLINEKKVKVKYNTQITVEVTFGPKKLWGIMGSMGFQDYGDANNYHLTHFSGGMLFGF